MLYCIPSWRLYLFRVLLRLYLLRLTGTQVESSWHCIILFSFWRLYLFTVLLGLYLFRLTPKMIPIACSDTQPLQVCKAHTRHLRCQLAVVPPPQNSHCQCPSLQAAPLGFPSHVKLCPLNLPPCLLWLVGVPLLLEVVACVSSLAFPAFRVSLVFVVSKGLWSNVGSH